MSSPDDRLPTPDEAPRQIGVSADRLRHWVAGFAERHGALHVTVTGDIGAGGVGAGGVGAGGVGAGGVGAGGVVQLVGADGARAWIDVPFPPLAADGEPLDALLAHVERRRRIGVLLVRRGGYGVGVFDGADLIASKVGSSYVQGTTKAGGWSQQRYARRRANQADAAFADAADVAARLLGRAPLDALVAGGDRDAVRAVLADRRLAHLHPTGPWLQVKDPKLRILAATPEQFRAVRIRLSP